MLCTMHASQHSAPAGKEALISSTSSHERSDRHGRSVHVCRQKLWRAAPLGRRTSDFQSEKTGSTPVGSAMNPLKNLVGTSTVCHYFKAPFATRGSFAVLPLGYCLLGKLSLIGALHVVRDHAACGMAGNGLDGLLTQPEIGKLARSGLAQPMKHAIVGQTSLVD